MEKNWSIIGVLVMFGIGFIMGIAGTFGFLIFLVSTDESNSPEDNSAVFSDVEIGNYWSCMDGCFNMQEVLFGNISYENQTQKAYHTQCTEQCWNQTVNVTNVGVLYERYGDE